MPAANSLFQMQRIGTLEQHIHIVVGLQDKSITLLKPGFNQVGGNPQIGANAESSGLVLDDKTARFARIVRDGKGSKLQVADGKSSTGAENLQVGELSDLRRNFVQGALAQIDRKVKTPAHDPHASYMVLVLMTNDDRVQVACLYVTHIHAPYQLFSTEARVEKNSRSGTANQDGITFRTAGKNLKIEGHKLLSRNLGQGALRATHSCKLSGKNVGRRYQSVLLEFDRETFGLNRAE